MALEIRIDINDLATPALNAIAQKLSSRRSLNEALGARGERELRDHFGKREAEPNKTGWPRQHFWDQIRSATAVSRVDEQSATITINDPRFNQKFYGGTIKPGAGKKYLTLPAIAAAYGSPATAHKLTPIFRYLGGERRAVALAEVKGKGRERTETVWYWLVKSVTQNKDERALPDRDQFAGALRDEAQEFLDSLGR